MAFTINAVENAKNNWTVIVNGESIDKTKCYYSKKVKFKGCFDDATINAVKILKIENEEYKIGDIETLQVKQDKIEFNRKPIPRLYNKLLNSDVEFDIFLLDDGSSIVFYFNQYFLDDIDPLIYYSWGGYINSSGKLSFKTFMHCMGTDKRQVIDNIKKVDYLNKHKTTKIKRDQSTIFDIVFGDWKKIK